MPPHLSIRQFSICIGYGGVVWLLAALLLRELALAGWLDGAARAAVFVLAVPGSIPVVLLLRRLAGLGRGRLLAGTAVATGAAVLLDGLALGWAPGLYGGPAHTAGRRSSGARVS
jgi:hypothetical protein